MTARERYGADLYHVGGRPSTWPRIARAERADDEIVDGRRVFNHHHVLALRPTVPEFSNGGSTVGEQTLPVCGIDPRPRDHAGAIARTDLRLVTLDDRIDRGRIDHALLDQYRLERLDAERHIRRNVLVTLVLFVGEQLRLG